MDNPGIDRIINKIASHYQVWLVPSCDGSNREDGNTRPIPTRRQVRKPWITTIKDSKPIVGENWPKACFVVYAQVPSWKKSAMPKDIDSLDKLQSHVEKAAKKAGVDIDKPFPFLVKGTVKQVKYHAIWKTDGLPHTKALHEKAKLEFEVKDREVVMISFYSQHHHGVFTHHDSNLHVHFHTVDGRDSGHVEVLSLGGGMELFLPE